MLELEITESMAMQDPERTKELLHELNTIGIEISIDDFDTGHFSLSYVKSFPIRALKIGRCFVDGIPNNANDVAITRATVASAKSLGLHVIAEGIETEAQRSFLTEAQCEEGPRYLFGKPVPASDLDALLLQTWVGAPEDARASSAGG